MTADCQLLEHVTSEEAYSDVFEEDIPEPSPEGDEDATSDVTSVKSHMFEGDSGNTNIAAEEVYMPSHIAGKLLFKPADLQLRQNASP